MRRVAVNSLPGADFLTRNSMKIQVPSRRTCLWRLARLAKTLEMPALLLQQYLDTVINLFFCVFLEKNIFLLLILLHLLDNNFLARLRQTNNSPKSVPVCERGIVKVSIHSSPTLKHRVLRTPVNFTTPLNGSAVAHFEGEPFLVAGHLPESYRFRSGRVTASRRI